MCPISLKPYTFIWEHEIWEGKKKWKASKQKKWKASKKKNLKIFIKKILKKFTKKLSHSKKTFKKFIIKTQVKIYKNLEEVDKRISKEFKKIIAGFKKKKKFRPKLWVLI